MSETFKIKKGKTEDLKSFLVQRKTDKGDPYTNTSLYDRKSEQGWAGCFKVNDADLDTFFKLYYKAVFVNQEIFHLTEKHEKTGPILFDIDLRYSNTDLRIYNLETIHQLLGKIMVEIDKYLIIDNDQQRYAFVFEKSGPSQYNEELMKDGIHIMFPYLVTVPEIQYMIRNELLVSCVDIFSSLSVSNSIDDIIDESVIYRNCWQLYGSCKPGCESYKLTNIIKVDPKSDNPFSSIDLNTYDNEQLVSLLSIRNKLVPTSLVEETSQLIDQYHQNNKTKKIKEVQITTSINKRKRKGKKNTTNENIEIIKDLINILSPNRAETYKTWIEVGWCLHNIDYTLLDAWIEFSQKSNKYKHLCQKECTDLWDFMNDEGLNLGSLHFWAQKDNKEEYKQICNRDIEDIIQNHLTGTSYDTAKVVYAMYKHQYVCASIQHKTWYEFKNHRWQELDAGITLRKDISQYVVEKFLMMSSKLNNDSINASPTNPNKEIYINRSKKALETSLKLRTTAFKDQVMKEAAELFYDPKFYEKLDSYNDLLGFENGVYDLKNLEFREGRPEDYISLTTGIQFIEYDDNEPILQEINSFFHQVLPLDRVREYVLKLLASFMNGSTGNEKFHIWTGSGGNGKSKVIELFESSLGTYCSKLPITVITQKRPASNAAAPEMLRTKGRRFVCLQEPDDKEQIMVGCMKELTGGDKIQARGLYKEPVEFKPQFKMLLTCNQLPKVPSDDGGTWRRIRLVEFTSKFVENPVAENEYPIDLELTDKMKDWSEGFMFILMKYYKIYKLGDKARGIEPGLHEPKEVLACTNSYRMMNDIYSEFINENIEQHPKGVLKIEDAYSIFKVWYKDSYNSMKCPSKKELRGYMEKKYGTYNSRGKNAGWQGIRIIVDQVDDEEEYEKVGPEEVEIGI